MNDCLNRNSDIVVVCLSSFMKNENKKIKTFKTYNKNIDCTKNIMEKHVDIFHDLGE